MIGRRSLTVIAIGVVVICYLCVSNLLLPNFITLLDSPRYHLIPYAKVPAGNLSNSSEDAKDFVFVPSFFQTSPVLVSAVLSSDAYYVKLLSRLIRQSVSENDRSRFDCVCGRVSDECTCCGILHPCSGITVTNLNLFKFCLPTVLYTVDTTSPASFCVNITYMPLKRTTRTSVFLIPHLPPSWPDSRELRDNNLSYRPRFNKSLVLYSDLYISMDSPTVYCAENSKTDPRVSICVQWKNLQYVIASDAEHKTAFVGCGRVSVWVLRRFIIASYQSFCFSAHRGAIGDVDLEDSVKAASKLEDSPLPVLVSGSDQGNRNASSPHRPPVVKHSPIDSSNMVVGIP